MGCEDGYERHEKRGHRGIIRLHQLLYNGTSETIMIKLYSTASCVYCGPAKQWLKDNNIEFEEVILDTVDKIRLFVKKTGKLSVPVLELEDGNFITGFDEKTYEEHLSGGNKTESVL